MVMKMGDSYYNGFGIQVRDLLLPVGTLHLALGEFIPAGTAYLFNLDVIGPVEQPVPGKGNFFRRSLLKTEPVKDIKFLDKLVLTTVQNGFTKKLMGLSTEFTAPVGQKVVNRN